MKSLEIVNNKIAELEDTYQHYTAVEKDKAKSSFAKFDIEQFQKIKQDLEVLEIIRKKMSISKYGVFESKIMGVAEYNKITTREIKEDEFDREDFNKVKQWLEVNEDDR